MKGKKLLSVILAVMMIMQVLPVFAAEAGTAETTSTNINYIINDTFDKTDDLGNWTLGNFIKSSDSQEVEVAQTTITDGDKEVGVMKISSSTAMTEVNAYQVNAYNNFDDVAFDSNSKIVIETRFKQTGNADGYGQTQLMFNRPNITAFSGNVLGMNSYMLTNAIVNASKTNVEAKHKTDSTQGQTILSDVGVDTWINEKIVFDGTDGSNKEVTVSVWRDGETPATVTGTIKQVDFAFNDAGITDHTTGFTSLNSLTYTVRNYASTLYVDYVKVYKATVVDTYSQLLNGRTIGLEDSFKFQFVSDADIEKIPEGAVYVTDADGINIPTTDTFDAETQTLTLTPDSLTEGEVYTVNVDADAFDSLYLNYKGTTSFKVKARGAREAGVVISDDFEDGTVQGWAAGYASDDYKAKVSVAEIDGVKALKVTTGLADGTAIGGTGTGYLKLPNVYKELGNGIEFKEGAPVKIKGRAKMVASTGSPRFDLKLNRYNDTEQADHEGGWSTLSALHVESTKVQVPSSVYWLAGGSAWYTETTDVATAANVSTTLDKWIDFELEIDGVNNKNKVTAKLLNASGVETTYTKTGIVSQTTGSLNKTYGAYGKSDVKNPNYFNALDVVSFTLGANASTLYVDYIEVSQDATATASIAAEKFKIGSGFDVVFESDAALSELPDGAVKVTDANGNAIEVTKAYDANTKTLTVIPANVAEGDIVKVTIDKTALADSAVTLTGTTEFTLFPVSNMNFTTGKRIIANDTFETAGDMDNWVAGIYNGGESDTIKQTYLEENGEKIGVLQLSSPATSAITDITKVPHIFRDFADITIEEGKVIKIETRVKHNMVNAYNASSRARLTFNRPLDSTSSVLSGTNLTGFGGGFLACFTEKGVGYKNNNYGIDTLDANANSNEWINVEIVFDGKTKHANYPKATGYTMTVWTDGGEKLSAVGTTAEYNDVNAAALGGTKNEGYTVLKNLGFALEFGGNDLYVDYFKVSEIIAVDAKGELTGGMTMDINEGASLKLISDLKLTEAPKGLLTIEGVETVQGFNAETQTVTATPVSPLTEGETYKVLVNGDLLEDYALSYTGTESFNVYARNGRETKTTVMVNDFETAGDTEGWVLTESKVAANVSQTTEDNKGVLKFEVTGTPSDTNGGLPQVYKKVGNGVEYTDDNLVVVETSIKFADDVRFSMRHNAPNAANSLTHEQAWTGKRSLFSTSVGTNGTSLMVPWSRHTTMLGYQGQVPLTHNNGATVAFDSLAGIWLDVKVVMNYKTNCQIAYVTFEKDGETYSYSRNNDTKAGVYLTGSTEEYEQIFGKGTTKEFYDALESLALALYANGTVYVDYVKVSVKDDVSHNAYFTVNGEKATEFKPGDVVKPEYSFTLQNPEETLTVISAIYEDGIMADIHFDTVKVTESDSIYTDEAGYTIPAACGNLEIKSFIWDSSIEGVSPMAEATTVASIKGSADE